MLIRNLCISFAIAATMVGCNNQPSEETAPTQSSEVSSATETVEKTTSTLPADAPTYNIYIDSNYPPFAYKDEFGNPAGFDIDILNAIGELSGFKNNFTGAPWDGIFDNLDNGRADIVGSGVSITDERKEVMSFTDPYIDTSPVMAYNSTSTESYDALATKRFGVQSGSSHLTNIVNKNNIPTSQITEYPTSFLALQGLLSSQVDVVVEDEAIIAYHLQSLDGKADVSNIKMAPLQGSENHPMAFAITKDRTDLVNEINDGLKTIRANGTYDKIYNDWFGHND